MPEQQHINLPAGSIEKHTTTINLGPTHPATHGVMQNILELDGEKVISAEQTIGYIHRAFEKIAERRPLYQITTLTDRLNYCSAPLNNMGWHLTCEKLLGVKTPKRVDYLRVIVMELARIADHLICTSIMAVDSGALTGFFYVMQFRELIYEIYEEICGSRVGIAAHDCAGAGCLWAGHAARGCDARGRWRAGGDRGRDRRGNGRG